MVGDFPPNNKKTFIPDLSFNKYIYKKAKILILQDTSLFLKSKYILTLYGIGGRLFSQDQFTISIIANLALKST